MEQLISDIIFLTLNKVKIYGLNLMMKEFDNLTLEILKMIVLVGKIGEDNLKVLICWFMKKSKNDQSSFNLTHSNKNNKFLQNSISKKL